MFDFVDKHKRMIMIALFLLILPPFALFGIESYFTGRDAGQAVAQVGDQVISPEEFSRGLRDQQQALQRMMEGKLDPSLLDTPELRRTTLETLIQRRLLLGRALQAGAAVPNDLLKSFIAEQPAFRDESGKFSFALYEQYLRTEGMTPVQFESRLRQDLMLQQITDGYGGTGFAPRTAAEQVARLSEQQREVSQYVVAPEQFMTQIKLEPGAAKQYYDANTADFRTPEQARVEYVALSMDALGQQVQIDPAEVKKYYEANLRQFGIPETRQVSHILIEAGSSASPEVKQKARAKAEEIYKELQKNPESFAEMARKESQDTGSAARGGDLGRIGRGTMKDVPEFEAAAFKLKAGEISPPVETRYGYQIVRVINIQPAQVKPFEEVRAQIEGELRKQVVAKRFAELADQFNNVVYEQSESLKPAADLAKAAPKSSGWITRDHAEDPLLNNPRLLAAIFSDDVLRNRRNTEAIEVAPGVLVAARLAEHRPAAVQPFGEVKAAVEKRLALQEAGRLAGAEGRRLLGELKQGKSVQVAWGQPQVVSRADRKAMADPVIRQVFRVDTSKLPAYAGVETLPGAYYLVRVSRVQEAEKIPPEKIKAIGDELRQVLAQETLMSYVAGLRQKAGVKINKDLLEKKQ